MLKPKEAAERGINPLSAFSRKGSLGVLALVIMLVIAGIAFFSNNGKAVQMVNASNDGHQKKYRATRAIVRDKDSGQLRMPTSEEVDQMVASLDQLTKQPEGLPETSARSGVAVDLEGGYGGTMLVRANSDGLLETRCVFTFQEGTDFLGLVEDTDR